MIVLRKTMDRAVAETAKAARNELLAVMSRYGRALDRVVALQEQLSAWIMEEPGNITPEQMAIMFYAQDDRWQAAFFNCMQETVQAHHDSLPEPRRGEIRLSAGSPAGEGQWYHMAKHLNASGLETLDVMFSHANFVSLNGETEADRVGDSLDDRCNVNSCSGTLKLDPVEDCSCHISSPCSACVDRPLVCTACEREVAP